MTFTGTDPTVTTISILTPRSEKPVGPVRNTAYKMC